MPFLLRLGIRLGRGGSHRSAIHNAKNASGRIKARDWRAAEYFARVAIANDATWPEGYRLLSFAYRGAGKKPDEARTALEQGLCLAPLEFRVLMDFGDFERDERRFEAAEQFEPTASDNRLPFLTIYSDGVPYRVSRALGVTAFTLDDALFLVDEFSSGAPRPPLRQIVEDFEVAHLADLALKAGLPTWALGDRSSTGDSDLARNLVPV